MKKIALITCLLFAAPTYADPPIVEDIRLEQSGVSWSVSVTLRHEDTGWDDYADGWRIETADGTILGHRVLVHPHVDEQPFTRSLHTLMLPEDQTKFFVRPRDLIGGWSEQRFEFQKP